MKINKFYTVGDIAIKNKQLGHHFFDEPTMRFFDSKLPSHKVYRDRFFVTSEQFHDTNGNSDPRKYTVRMAMDDGQIETIGKFNELSSEQSAINFINKLPFQFYEAYKLARDCFNSNEARWDDFLKHAKISRDHKEPELQREQSFTGACYLLCRDWELYDFSWIGHMAKQL